MLLGLLLTTASLKLAQYLCHFEFANELQFVYKAFCFDVDDVGVIEVVKLDLFKEYSQMFV